MRRLPRQYRPAVRRQRVVGRGRDKTGHVFYQGEVDLLCGDRSRHCLTIKSDGVLVTVSLTGAKAGIYHAYRKHQWMVFGDWQFNLYVWSAASLRHRNSRLLSPSR